MRVMSPGAVNNHRDLLANIGEWQVRVGACSRDHGEAFSEKMRSVAFVQMTRVTSDMSCAGALTPSRSTEGSETRSGTTSPTGFRWRTRGQTRWISVLGRARGDACGMVPGSDRERSVGLAESRAISRRSAPRTAARGAQARARRKKVPRHRGEGKGTPQGRVRRHGA